MWIYTKFNDAIKNDECSSDEGGSKKKTHLYTTINKICLKATSDSQEENFIAIVYTLIWQPIIKHCTQNKHKLYLFTSILMVCKDMKINRSKEFDHHECRANPWRAIRLVKHFSKKDFGCSIHPLQSFCVSFLADLHLRSSAAKGDLLAPVFTFD
ncbi:hypothetical protein BY458DRAFT_485981 [Sporodiniella umbellata]|nr:hypothetical protein BY458DRAFT_485981 [Sporodiniella umbellata]